MYISTRLIRNCLIILLINVCINLSYIKNYLQNLTRLWTLTNISGGDCRFKKVYKK